MQLQTERETCEWFSVGAVAHHYGVSRSHVLKLIRMGRLKAVKLGGIYRIADEELNEMERRATVGEAA